ncbi:hypothetical protein ALC56_12003 [Trachymyrmex septentrionalis]|uniref:Uncharacterized protein n=1 Tax=Trachymyrmex septentrionalis TaxID=34720 RepID=A0A195EZL6_9HYME|nr:hypothetical protein ALC56_12003 [Trachymyrmex septentrionalis]
MTRMALVVMLILFSISSVNFVDSLQESLGKFLGTFGAKQQVRIPELLNQLCNQSQGSNLTIRDACYGCFYRASILPQGYSMLVAMSACANTYLNNTSYGHCQAYLQNVTSMPDARSPAIIYCSFLECIRQVNKNSLAIVARGVPLLRGTAWQIKQRNFFKFLKSLRRGVCIIRETITTTTNPLRECVREASTVFPNINNTYINLTNTQLVQLFINTTTCVLAKTRCSYVNPVTGELQDSDIVNKLHLPSLNALLVNTDYDISIVQLPFRSGSVDVCTKYRNVEQATWPSVVC